jgi:hypothetical protein
MGGFPGNGSVAKYGAFSYAQSNAVRQPNRRGDAEP